MESILFVAVGGGVGSVTRYLASLWAAERFGVDFPYGTLIVNVVGCYIIGLFMVLATEKYLLPTHWRLLIASGFLGGLTTFSSFSYETLNLAQEGAWSAAVVNLAANLITGLLSTGLGVLSARAL
ncbi:MAG: fluoride efflux transporter CrcB [Negativicutes bacterium]